MQMTNNKVHSYKMRFDFSILQMEIPDNQFHGYVVFFLNLTFHQMEIPDNQFHSYVVFFFKSYHPSNGNSW
jgi:hypothetical protein